MDTPDLTRAQWHTSKDRQGPKLVLQRAQWHRFISSIKAAGHSNA